jgi:hypothetical protein
MDARNRKIRRSKTGEDGNGPVAGLLEVDGRLVAALLEIGIGAEGLPRSPATPPGMRVRTGRFEELRLRGQPGDAQAVEVADREGYVDEHARVLPPSAGVAGDLRSAAFGEAPGA